MTKHSHHAEAVAAEAVEAAQVAEGVVQETETPAPAPVPVVAEAAAVAKPANSPPKGPRNVAQNATIKLGSDKEGKSYGPEHNPKKPGSATHGRFALYRDGMTISEAVAAGITSADLDYDAKKGFIVVTQPPAANTETAPAVAAA